MLAGFARARGQLKTPFGRWNELVHHRGYAGSFVEFAGPGKERSLIEISSTRACGRSGGSVVQGWEFQLAHPPAPRRSARQGPTGKTRGNPAPVTMTVETSMSGARQGVRSREEEALRHQTGHQHPRRKAGMTLDGDGRTRGKRPSNILPPRQGKGMARSTSIWHRLQSRLLKARDARHKSAPRRGGHRT